MCLASVALIFLFFANLPSKVNIAIPETSWFDVQDPLVICLSVHENILFVSEV